MSCSQGGELTIRFWELMSCLRKMIIHLFLQQETRKKPVTPVPYNRYDQERFRGKEGMMQSLAFTVYH